MSKITISDYKFTCPMLNKEISQRGELKFAACAKCEFNALHQIVDDTVYCNYGSSASAGTGTGVDSTSLVLNSLIERITNLENVVEENIELDSQQQGQINQVESNQQTITYVTDSIGWEDYTD